VKEIHKETNAKRKMRMTELQKTGEKDVRGLAAQEGK